MIRSLAAAAALTMTPPAPAAPVPVVASHQHLASPAFAALLKTPVYDGAALLADLDRAGIRRGVVLSVAYSFADPRKDVPDPDTAVRRENDWTSVQVTASQGRLIGFCSVNPLRAAARAEIERCLKLPGMIGLKLHFGNSGVSLRDPSQLRRLTRIFSDADRLNAPIVVHMRARTTSPYGAEDARLFLDHLLPAAPHVVVQVAHLAGAGEFPKDAEEALDVFATALGRRDARVRRLYFDQTSVIDEASTPHDALRVAQAIRAVGVDRVLFGSDLPIAGNPPPGESWRLFASRVALTAEELSTIAAARAPYLPAGW